MNTRELERICELIDDATTRDPRSEEWENSLRIAVAMERIAAGVAALAYMGMLKDEELRVSWELTFGSIG